MDIRPPSPLPNTSFLASRVTDQDDILSPSPLGNSSVTAAERTTQVGGVTPLVTSDTYTVFILVNSYVLTGSIAVFGVCSNSLNLVVYLKLGLRETTNMSFFTLAIVDWVVSVCSCLSVFPHLPFEFARQIQHMGYHVAAIMFPCLGLGAWVTAMLSVERCLCIVFPLKVKTIVTRQRLVCLICGMAVYQVVFAVLMLTIVHPPYNKPNATRVVLLLYSVSIPVFLCFTLVLCSTSFMVIRLRRTLEWRTATTAQAASTSGVKERKVVLSVLWVCIMFIVCFTPNVALFVTTVVFPSFTLWDPYYGWLVHIIYTFSYLFQAVSSASNIIVYYNVSTRFRDVLKGLFVRK